MSDLNLRGRQGSICLVLTLHVNIVAADDLAIQVSRGHFNIKILSYQFRYSLYEYKTVS